MKILVACEESQAVTIELRRLGHEAYSCDIQECSGGHPEWHIQGDALKTLLGGDIRVMTGDTHTIPAWDLVIAHPPCTYISNAGACRLYPQKGVLNYERLSKGLQGKLFFMHFYLYGLFGVGKIAIENPVPSRVFALPEKSQVIQPYEFGDPFSKKTYLWLFGLKPLEPTNVLTEFVPYVSCGTSSNKGKREKAGVSRKGGASKVRSRTFPGIAAAMAEQWGASP